MLTDACPMLQPSMTFVLSNNYQAGVVHYLLATPDVLPTALASWVPTPSPIQDAEPNSMITPSFADAVRDNAAGMGIYQGGGRADVLYQDSATLSDMPILQVVTESLRSRGGTQKCGASCGKDAGMRCGCMLKRGDRVEVRSTTQVGASGTLYAVCVDGKGSDVFVPFDTDLAVSPVDVAPIQTPALSAAPPTASPAAPPASSEHALPPSLAERVPRALSVDVPPTVPLRGVSGRGNKMDGQNKQAKRGYERFMPAGETPPKHSVQFLNLQVHAINLLRPHARVHALSGRTAPPYFLYVC